MTNPSGAINMHDCVKYEDCQWRINVGSCPPGCYQFKDKHERRVVLCTECKHQEECSRNTLYIKAATPQDGLKFYEYHQLEYCSAGEPKEDNNDRS